MSNYDIHTNEYALLLIDKILLERLRQSQICIKNLFKDINKNPANAEQVELLYAQGIRLVSLLSRVHNEYSVANWTKEYSKYLAKTPVQIASVTLSAIQLDFLKKIFKVWGTNNFVTNDANILENINAFVEIGLVNADYSEDIRGYVFSLTSDAVDLVKD